MGAMPFPPGVCITHGSVETSELRGRPCRFFFNEAKQQNLEMLRCFGGLNPNTELYIYIHVVSGPHQAIHGMDRKYLDQIFQELTPMAQPLRKHLDYNHI